MKTRYAVVTDGLWRNSLSAIRSLGKAGFEITVMGDTWLTTGFWSRFARRRHRGPLASVDPDAFCGHLEHVLRQCPEKPLLVPMSQTSLLAVAEHQDRFAELAWFLFPDLDNLHIAASKRRTMDLAQQLDLPCPVTVASDTIEAFVENALAFPHAELVLKPTRGLGSHGVKYLLKDDLDAEELRRHWQAHGPLLIQERVPAAGEALGASLVMDKDGTCLACFCHKRLHQYPITGGPSTNRVSIRHPEIAQMSTRLLRALAWRGVAMVEWKVHPATGRPLLMEINPRFWGSLELGIRAGVDFPLLYAKAALGEPVVPVMDYEEGVRCRWMAGDILRYLSQARTDREGLARFCRGFFSESEEWDRRDVRGWMASFLCKGLLVLRPAYWKYLRR